MQHVNLSVHLTSLSFPRKFNAFGLSHPAHKESKDLSL